MIKQNGNKFDVFKSFVNYDNERCVLVAILIFFLFLYGFTPFEVLSFDGYLYTLAFGGKIDGSALLKGLSDEIPDHFENLNFFHPHHLLYHVFGIGISRLAGSSLSDIPIIMKCMNIIFGIFGLWGFYQVGIFIFKKYIWAVFITLFLGFSPGYWYHCLEVEMYIIPQSLLIFIYFYLQKTASFQAKEIILISLFHAIATLFHTSSALFGAIICYHILTNRNWKYIFLYSGCYVFFVLTPLVFIGIYGVGCRNFNDLIHYLFLYSYVFSTLDRGGILQLGIAVTRLIDLIVFFTPPIFVLIRNFVIIILFSSVLWTKSHIRFYIRKLFPLYLWVFIYFCFFLFLFPYTNDYYIFCLPPFILLIGYNLWIVSFHSDFRRRWYIEKLLVCIIIGYGFFSYFSEMRFLTDTFVYRNQSKFMTTRHADLLPSNMAPIFWESSVVPEFWDYINKNKDSDKKYYYQFYGHHYPDISVSRFIQNSLDEKKIPILFFRYHKNVSETDILSMLERYGFKYSFLINEKIPINETFRYATIDRHSKISFYNEMIIAFSEKKK